MVKSAGKITFTSLFTAALLLFGGFAAFKEFSAITQENSVRKQIKDTMGMIRGRTDTEERGLEAIYSILEKNGVADSDLQEVDLTVRGNRLNYTVAFEITIDLLLFKRVRKVLIQEDMANYG